MTPRLSVLVPSYGRPDSLARCLTALGAQTRAPDEVVVGVRIGDNATVAAAEAARAAGLPVRIATTATAGVVASMQAALDAVTGDIVALTDDDARPFPTWIEKLLAHFASAPDVGGVGGRDWQPYERGNAQRVGVVQWFGRVIGNHHLGAGPARDVDVLKGVNCSFRAPLLRAVGFDGRLRGAGAQLYWELGVCLPIRRAGWRLIYDPSVAVDHDVATRLDADHLHRGVFAEPPLVDAVHNETVALLEGRHLAASVCFRVWAFLIGTGEEPGPVQVARRLLLGDRLALRRWRATVTGRLAGASTERRARRKLAVPPPPGR
ncbi:MAG: glycosyltransferase family 2 protein [Gemmatimonadaceae bacterium]|nr:glycosyltransferase family 2 protein [Gemmatimonadaceae bacterium]